MGTKLRLGRIDYVNADPFFSHNPCPASLSVVAAKPASLNRMLAAGELDLSWVSSIELLRHPDQWLLCPYFCISAPGPVMSVVLTSPTPLEELGGETIWLTRFSAASVSLLKVLLASQGIECGFQTYDHEGPLPKGPTLLIGDEALRQANQPSDRHVYDLAELWKAETGLPMVFAVLALRAEVLSQSELLDAVDDALDWMGSNLCLFRKSPLESPAYQTRDAGLSAFHYERYFAGFCFEWNARTQSGFEAYRARAHALGLCSATQLPAFYDPILRAVRPLAAEGAGPS